MNRPASLAPNALTPRADAPRADARGPAFGWTISLLAHALAGAWLWHAWPRPPEDTDAHPVERIEVRLLPPMLARAHAPALVTPHAAPHVAPHAARLRPRIAPAASNPAAAVPIPDLVQPGLDAGKPAGAGAGTSTDAPGVDLGAARAAARRIAHDDAANLVALPRRRLVVDPNADRHVVDPIEGARRVSCETARAQSTNLLANVVGLAIDLAKNAIDDSGCKW